MELDINVREVGSVSVLEIQGDMDVYVLPSFQSRIQGLLDEGRVNLVADFGGVDYVNSTAVAIVVEQWKAVKEKGGDLKLAGLSEFLTKTFEMIGVHRIISIHADTDSAVASF